MLEGRRVLVAGERDQKDGGAWPGRDGARKVAAHLAADWEEKVEWTLPPEGTKDARAWLMTRVEAGLDLADAAMCKAAGEELLAALSAAARLAKVLVSAPGGEEMDCHRAPMRSWDYIRTTGSKHIFSGARPKQRLRKISREDGARRLLKKSS